MLLLSFSRPAIYIATWKIRSHAVSRKRRRFYPQNIGTDDWQCRYNRGTRSFIGRTKQGRKMRAGWGG